MGWTMFFMFFALKLPLLALAWLVWWAVHAEPELEAEPETEPPDDGGGWRSRHPQPPRPRAPRRGPHGDPAPTAPPRTRRTHARGRHLHR